MRARGGRLPNSLVAACTSWFLCVWLCVCDCVWWTWIINTEAPIGTPARLPERDCCSWATYSFSHSSDTTLLPPDRASPAIPPHSSRIRCSSSFSLLVLHLYLLFSGALRFDFTSVGLAPTPCGLHCPRPLRGCVLTHAGSGRHAERFDVHVGALRLHVLRACATGWIATVRGPCGPVDAKSC